MLQKRIAYPLLFILGMFVAWEAAIFLLKVPIYILPPPTKIIQVIEEKFWIFLPHIGITLGEALCGFAIGCSGAFMLAVIMVHSRFWEMALYPLMISLYATPTVAMAPFVLLWLGVGFLSKTIIVALISFFPVVINLSKGLRNVKKEQMELLNIYKANKWEVFYKVRLPSSLPYFFSGVKISITLSVTGAVVAEFVGSNTGLGYLILQYQSRFDIAAMFASLTFLSLIGVSLFGVISLIENKFLYWHQSKDKIIGI